MLSPSRRLTVKRQREIPRLLAQPPHQALRASCLAAARSGAALTNERARPCEGPSRTECLRHVIHFRAPASQPRGKPGY